MQPTYIGVIAALMGLLALSRPMTVMLLAVVVACIFGAASAVNATALGGATIQPSVFLLMFVVLRIARSRDMLSNEMESAIKDCALFAIFVAYGVVSAYLLPRLFAHQIELPPTRMAASGTIFAVAPLAPSAQNITQSTYLIGTLLMLVATVFIARIERRSRLVARTLVYLCWAHIAFGVTDIIFNAMGLPILDIVRNASYTIVDQEIGGFRRIQGSFSETSAYSGFGFVLLVFVTELWLRQVEPRLTGWTTLILALMLFFSTSTSAYVGLSLYGVILAFRITYFPSTTAQRKALILAGLGIVAILLVLMLVVLLPTFIQTFGGVLADMTTKKGRSESGVQRGFWIQKSWDAFLFSKGLGVGVGSSRSSSLISAIAGSMGVIGLATFLAFIYRVLPVHRLASYRLDGDKTQAVGAAGGWAAIVGLGPALVSGTNPDPGLMFAFMSGLAIAWAPHAQKAQKAHNMVNASRGGVTK